MNDMTLSIELMLFVHFIDFYWLNNQNKKSIKSTVGRDQRLGNQVIEKWRICIEKKLEWVDKERKENGNWEVKD